MFIQNIIFKFTLPMPVSDPPCPGRGIFISITFPNLEHSSRTSSNMSGKIQKKKKRKKNININ
jgi:hypothetical protein